MKKSMNVICLVLLLGFFTINVSASNVDYQSIQNEQNAVEKECEVYCNIPYSYSETIPKTPENNKKSNIVQTGDDNNFNSSIFIFILSGIGTGLLIRRNTKGLRGEAK